MRDYIRIIIGFFIGIVIGFFIIFSLGDFWSEWVRDGPEWVGDGPQRSPDTSGALLGEKHVSEKSTGKIYETPRRLKTVLFLRKDKNEKDAHQNSAYNDVTDSSPSFNLTPFVTKT